MSSSSSLYSSQYSTSSRYSSRHSSPDPSRYPSPSCYPSVSPYSSSQKPKRMVRMGKPTAIATDPRDWQACSRDLEFRRTYLQSPGTFTPSETRVKKIEEALRFSAYFALDEIKLVAQDAKGYLGERLLSPKERSATSSFGSFLKKEVRHIRKDCHLWHAAWKMGKEPSRTSQPARPAPAIKKGPLQQCKPQNKTPGLWYERPESRVDIGPGSRWE